MKAPWGALPLYRIQLQNPDGTPTTGGRDRGGGHPAPRGRASRWACSPSTWGTRRSTPRPGEAASTTQGTRPGQDEKGYYWFHGRFDDIIKTGGFRVGPFEVENILMEHPAVLECSVVGIPDPLRGQAIKAVVVPVPEREPSKTLEREIRTFCNSRLAEYKWVRTVEFVAAMPKTISGKIRKTELRT